MVRLTLAWRAPLCLLVLFGDSDGGNGNSTRRSKSTCNAMMGLAA